MAAVTLEQLTKVYPNGHVGLRELDLDIADGEFLVLVGPSGCGKTTALRMVAGLEEVTSGNIYIGDREVSRVPSRERDVAMVFQSYALYPHLDVAANIGFGLKLRKVPKAEIERRVKEAAEVLGLSELLDRKPRNLSGGQRQRVAMGRAIVREPQVFLMDEPLSNLDAKLRVQMRAEIAKLQDRLGVTTIYVTHDQTEAMTLGDRVAVMKRGVLQQVDSPQVLYDRPTNLFVGGFIGSPAMNLLQGDLERVGDSSWVLTLGSHKLELAPELLDARPAIAAYDRRTVVVGIRPEDISDADLDPGPHHSVLELRAELVEAMGSDVLVHVSLDTPQVLTEDARELAADVGEDLAPGAGTDERTSPVVARLTPRTAARARAPVRLSVDTTRLHVFDPETGAAVWDGEAAGS